MAGAAGVQAVREDAPVRAWQALWAAIGLALVVWLLGTAALSVEAIVAEAGRVW